MNRLPVSTLEYQPIAGDGYDVNCQGPVVQLKQTITVVTSNPAMFDQVMAPLTNSLKHGVHSEQVLLTIIEEIFQQVHSAPELSEWIGLL